MIVFLFLQGGWCSASRLYHDWPHRAHIYQDGYPDGLNGMLGVIATSVRNLGCKTKARSDQHCSGPSHTSMPIRQAATCLRALSSVVAPAPSVIHPLFAVQRYHDEHQERHMFSMHWGHDPPHTHDPPSPMPAISLRFLAMRYDSREPQRTPTCGDAQTK